ncbi:MAG: hypothetical protein ACRCTN_11055 [Carnobacterium maltaromaticum]
MIEKEKGKVIILLDVPFALTVTWIFLWVMSLLGVEIEGRGALNVFFMIYILLTVVLNKETYE